MAHRRPRGLLIGAVALGLVLASCSGQAPAPGDGLQVVATTTQVGALAAEIGGDAIDLSVLLEPGVEAHDFELSTADAAALERAGLILVSGAGLETWLEDALVTIGSADRVRDMSVGVELREGPDGHEDEGSAHEGEEGEELAEEHDPHYWLDAQNAIVMTRNVEQALAEALPAEADAFATRADAVVDRLEAADAEIAALIAQIPADDRQLVTDHDALGYFADAYGLELIGSVFPSMDVSAEPSAAQVAALVALIREHDVRAIFTESAINPGLAAAVAQETDAQLVEDPLYTDSLGPEGSGAETLDGMLLHNARVIHDALVGSTSG